MQGGIRIRMYRYSFEFLVPNPDEGVKNKPQTLIKSQKANMEDAKLFVSLLFFIMRMLAVDQYIIL